MMLSILLREEPMYPSVPGIHRLAILVVSFFIAEILLFGQANTASIRGTVTDASGAVVPGAQIILTRTGVKASDKTNAAGEYLFEFLPPGTYQVESQVAGFKTFVRGGIVLDLARQLRIDIGLEAGQLTE